MNNLSTAAGPDDFDLDVRVHPGAAQRNAEPAEDEPPTEDPTCDCTSVCTNDCP